MTRFNETTPQALASNRSVAILAWRQIRHLAKRAAFALKEGGFSLFARRLGLWAQLQRDRLLPSKAYRQWALENDATGDQLRRQSEWAESHSRQTLISIVCPLYCTPLPVLKETIQSAQDQSYPFWELCLTVCDEESKVLKEYIGRVTQEDRRIKQIQLASNAGISKNTNAAIEAARGEWIAFLDHDDLLAPEALYEVVAHLDSHPECDLIYSDEDLISSDGKSRRSPILKPDWSPEMLLHFNYICHFVAVRAPLLKSIGGLRSEYDGAQDWDLLLRLSEQTGRIHHIPKILYHWRELSTSTAKTPGAKPYVAEAQKRSLKDCLKRRGIEATIHRARYGHYRPTWKIAGDPLVSIIIPNRDQPALIRRLITGILNETDYPHAEIVIVDNNSTNRELMDLYHGWIQNGRVRVIDYREAFNYSAACNRGAAVARGDYLLFINNDIEITQADWLDELLKWGQVPGVGIAGPHLVYPDGRTQHAGIVLGLYELAGHSFHQCPPETYGPFGLAEWARNVSAVTGACQLIKKQLFDQIGGYDEKYQLLYSDIELCLRAIRQGDRVVYTPHCRLIHHECATRDPRQKHRADARRFAEMLRANQVTRDPYYHPALSAASRSPQLKPKSALNVNDNLQRLIESHIERQAEKAAHRRAA